MSTGRRSTRSALHRPVHGREGVWHVSERMVADDWNRADDVIEAMQELPLRLQGLRGSCVRDPAQDARPRSIDAADRR
jgi:hypothetical protein